MDGNGVVMDSETYDTIHWLESQEGEEWSQRAHRSSPYGPSNNGFAQIKTIRTFCGCEQDGTCYGEFDSWWHPSDPLVGRVVCACHYLEREAGRVVEDRRSYSEKYEALLCKECQTKPKGIVIGPFRYNIDELDFETTSL